MPYYAAADGTSHFMCCWIILHTSAIPRRLNFPLFPHNFNVSTQQLMHLVRHLGENFFFSFFLSARLGPRVSVINKAISKVKKQKSAAPSAEINVHNTQQGGINRDRAID